MLLLTQWELNAFILKDFPGFKLRSLFLTYVKGTSLGWRGEVASLKVHMRPFFLHTSALTGPFPTHEHRHRYQSAFKHPNVCASARTWSI